MKKLLVLGAGTAGTMIVNRLRRRLGAGDWDITVVDNDDVHRYQPGYLFLPFGTYTPQQITRSRHTTLPDGVDFVIGDVDPVDAAAHTVTLDFNDADQVRAVFREIGDQIACVIVEPIAGNMNCVPPAAGFLQGLRDACDEHGVVLIFDEVTTGFRFALGGAQAYYRLKPDLHLFGKTHRCGRPVGRCGKSWSGRRPN